jgi:hypothetical protein
MEGMVAVMDLELARLYHKALGINKEKMDCAAVRDDA